MLKIVQTCVKWASLLLLELDFNLSSHCFFIKSVNLCSGSKQLNSLIAFIPQLLKISFLTHHMQHTILSFIRLTLCLDNVQATSALRFRLSRETLGDSDRRLNF